MDADAEELGYVKGNVNYTQLAEEVFLITRCEKTNVTAGWALARRRLPQGQSDEPGVRSGEAGKYVKSFCYSPAGINTRPLTTQRTPNHIFTKNDLIHGLVNECPDLLF